MGAGGYSEMHQFISRSSKKMAKAATTGDLFRNAFENLKRTNGVKDDDRYAPERIIESVYSWSLMIKIFLIPKTMIQAWRCIGNKIILC
jgi:hypothetical protein